MTALGFGLLLCLDVMTLTLTYSVVVIQIKNLWSFAVVRFQPLAARQEVMKNQKKGRWAPENTPLLSLPLSITASLCPSYQIQHHK